MRNYPHDQNPLEYRYTFWLSKRKSVLKGKNYENCMTKLGSFETVQQFWKMYSFMKRPSKVDDHCDLMLVRFDDFIFEPPINPLSSSNLEFDLFGKKNQIATEVDGRFVFDDTTQIDIGRMQLWP